MYSDRRDILKVGALGALAAASPAMAAAAQRPAGKGAFPANFLWGSATAGHQVEGGNVNSDTWVIEHLKPSPFVESSGDACDSFHRWPLDLDIVRSLGLSAYRFSVEWSRIEPAEGEFSIAMLDHYKAMIDGCRARGLKPVVTLSHFTMPRWFALKGGWTNPEAPRLFARYADRVARHMADGIHAVVTLNEPNLMPLLRWKLPPQVFAGTDSVRAAAAKAYGSSTFVALFIESVEQTKVIQPTMIAAHKAAKAAVKAVRGTLPVGVSLAIEDDQAVGPNSKIEAKRAYCYAPWLEAASADDFVGVQNYERSRIDAKGDMPVAADAPKSTRGSELYPASLAGAVRYAHATAKVPVLVTEHGVGSDDDRHRAAIIPAALQHLKTAMDEGVPVLGYIHWSLLDNFEWLFGFGPKFGLCSVDRTTFKRTPKPSAGVLARIARQNAV